MQGGAQGARVISLAGVYLVRALGMISASKYLQSRTFAVELARLPAVRGIDREKLDTELAPVGSVYTFHVVDRSLKCFGRSV